MSNVHVYEPKDDSINRKATAEELANVPRMSRSEMISVMKSPDYKRSKLAQQLIARSLELGLLDEPGEAPVNADYQSGDEIAAKQSHFRKMFASKEYKTDPEYRHKVQQELKALTVNDQPLEDGALSMPNKVTRVSLSPFAHEAARVESLGVHRAESRATEPKAPVSKPVQKEYFE
ncbi:MAG: hypothetical protein JSR29_15860 [Nitrospira sp.]|nr:hypothetical protein [Nitrospira sp.]